MLVNFIEMMNKAKKGHYAIPQFNINNLEWTKYILEQCNEMKVPVILGVSEGATKYMGGYKAVSLMVKGLIIRLLILPGHKEDTKKIIKYIYETYKDSVFISIMNQYTPVTKSLVYPNLNWTVTDSEYCDVINYACDLGVTKAFIQEGETASESFIPDFDCSNV